MAKAKAKKLVLKPADVKILQRPLKHHSAEDIENKNEENEQADDEREDPHHEVLNPAKQRTKIKQATAKESPQQKPKARVMKKSKAKAKSGIVLHFLYLIIDWILV